MLKFLTFKYYRAVCIQLKLAGQPAGRLYKTPAEVAAYQVYELTN